MDRLIYEFYILCAGIEPSEEAFNRTKATANYLKDNGYKDTEILKIFNNIVRNKPKNDIDIVINGEDLPIELWEDSLLEKDTFYYSDIVHIKSKPPSWDPITFTEISHPFYLEMKIKFTMNELLDYYYDKCRVPNALQDEKKDSGAFNHLIKKYNAFKKLPGIDYVIALINKASEDIEKDFICEVFDLDNYKEEVIIEFDGIYEQSTFEKVNQIVWRS